MESGVVCEGGPVSGLKNGLVFWPQKVRFLQFFLLTGVILYPVAQNDPVDLVNW